MGKVNVRFVAVNYDDQSDFARKRSERKPRRVEAEALVDTGETRLYFQRRVIGSLGLRPVSQITSRTMSDRAEKRTVFSPVELEIQGHKAVRRYRTSQLAAEHHRSNSSGTLGLGSGPTQPKVDPESGAQAWRTGRRVL
jgi:predicted aspartyl protease